MIYELRAEHDTRDSFYGKAQVEVKEDGTKVLTSYNTEVAEVDNSGTAKVFGYYSTTTSRHVKEFLKQEGFVAESSRQVIKDYGVEE